MAAFTTSSLALGTNTVTASYGGTAAFAPSTTGTIVTSAGDGIADYRVTTGPRPPPGCIGPWGVAVDSAGDLFISDAA